MKSMPSQIEAEIPKLEKINKITGLDFSLIKQKIAKSGTPYSFLENAEQEYKRFLIMIAVFPTERIVPSADADFFWHQHILDTRRYFGDTTHIFGYFLHHQPSYESSQNNLLKFKIAEEKTKALYRNLFNTEMSSALASCSDGDNGSCWSVSAEE